VPHGRRPRTFARRVRLRAPRGPTGRDPGGRDVPPALAPSLATARAAAGGGSAPAGHDRQGPDSMMRAAVLTGGGGVTLTRCAPPEPGPGQLRVRLEGSGVCGSNLPVW